MENRKKIQNLLENVIRASQILIEKGYLDAQEGQARVRCLMGIRQRFLSDDYMRKTPKGFDIDEIDEMTLSLDRMLVDAGKRGYRNAISYILKAVIQGTGVGHRILTEEEEKNRAIVLLQRKLKMQNAMEAVEDAWKLDEKISSRKFTIKRQEMLRKDCKIYEEKIETIKQSRPDILEELLYFTDVEDVSADALEYIELTSSLENAKKNIIKNENDLENLEELIGTYMQVLEQAKRWDLQPDIQVTENLKSKVLQEKMSGNPEKAQIACDAVSDPIISIKTDTGTHFSEQKIVGLSENYKKTDDTLSQNISSNQGEETILEEDLISEETILEMQKIIEKFVDEDSPDMIDLGYEAMERAFASPELKAYVEKSLQEYEELGFSEELSLTE